MSASATRSTRGPMVLCVGALLAVALTGCGAPRVHEVYRLSAAEPWADATSAATQGLTEAQAELRQMALNVHELRGPRIRSGSVSSAESTAALTLGSSGLHGCLPGDLAEFTVRSASPAKPAGDVPRMFAGLGESPGRW
jgi:hypothetical protein